MKARVAPDEPFGVSLRLSASSAGTLVGSEPLRAQLKDRLSAYKVPGEIIVLRHEDIPRTASGCAAISSCDAG